MTSGQILVKGPDRLAVFLEVVELYKGAAPDYSLKIISGEGLAVLNFKDRKLKILTSGFNESKPRDL